MSDRIEMRSGTLALALLVCTGALGRADDLGATYGGDLEEAEHRARVTIEDGLARIAVTRTFHNAGDRPDEALLSIDLPTGAVARSLRVRPGKRWYQGELLAAAAAQHSYQQLTSDGEEATPGPALLQWTDSGELELQAYPVAAGGRLQIEYTLEAPLCYANGSYVVDYPRSVGPGMVAPVVRARGGRVFADAAAAAAALEVDDPRAGCDPAAWNAPDEASYLVFPAPASRPIAARHARASVVADLGIARVEVDAAAVLEPLPRGAAVVFVVDGSRSVGPDDVAAQLRVARAYLRHVPDARFEVVVYRRHGERLFGRLVAAAGADALLDEIAASRFERGNGSNLEGGLELAAAALAGHRGPTRIVAFTDDLLRAAFTLEAATDALSAAPARTILHLARIDFGGGVWSFSRDDDHALAPLAAATGGMAVWLGGGSDDLGAAAEALLGLVRPVRIDSFAVEVPGADRDELAVPDTLEEGEAFRRTVLVAAGTGPAVVRGRIWGRPLERRIDPDAALAKRLPGLIFGTSLWSLLPEEELPALATAAGVVSPVTSYLARDRRAIASGRPVGGSGGTTYGSICGGHCTGAIGAVGSARAGELAAQVDRRAVLGALLADRARGCFVRHGDVADEVLLDLETTRNEIVDVIVTSTTGAELGQCLAEAAWELRLDDRFFEPHDRYTLHLTHAELPAQ